MLLNLLISLSTLFSGSISDTSYQLIIGSYTQEGNPGIEVFTFDGLTGATRRAYTLQQSNASYLTLSADRKYLYAVSEEAGGKGSVQAYQQNALGVYSRINGQPTLGDAPCFITYRASSKTVYTANYSGGSLSVLPTEQGQLLSGSQHIVYSGSSVNKARQQAPHAHNVVLSPDENYLYVADLGTDRIHQHRINPDGTVDPKDRAIKVKAGNGPRHLVFDKKGTLAYLINELSGTVDVFAVAEGQLKWKQSVIADTTATPVKGSADIHISPSGKWLLTSNRVTSNQVTVFSIQSDGTLRKVRHVEVARRPRNFSFDPSGKWLLVAGQEENKIQVFSFQDDEGTLTDVHQDIAVPMPVCLLFAPVPGETDPEERIQTLQIKLIPPTAPIANYVKYNQVGNLIYLSGHGPDKPGGGQVVGKVGKELTLEEGQQAARLTGISLLSTLKGYIGDLNKVKRIVKVMGFVNGVPEFTQQPQVMNGFSNLMVEIFGERGKHARTSVGASSLPNNIAVEIEMIVELK